jgi:hypothetical protein
MHNSQINFRKKNKVALRKHAYMCSAFCSFIKWVKKNKSAHTPHDGKTFGDNNTMNTNVGVRRKKIQGQANLSMKQGNLFCLSC